MRWSESRDPSVRRGWISPVSGLLTVALVLLLIPLVEGHQLAWPAWTIAALVMSFPALGLFALHQRRRERRGASPLVPPSLFRRRSFSGGTLATLTFFSGPPALFFAITIALQGIGISPLDTALAFVPLSLASVPTAAVSVALARRWGRVLVIAGALIVVLGIAGLLASVTMAGAVLTTSTLLPGLVVTGLGLGLVSPALIDVVLAGLDPRDTGAASGVRSTASQLGGAIGVALIGLVFYAGLPAHPSTPGEGYAHALAGALWYALAVALLSALAMLLLPKPAPIPQRLGPCGGGPRASARCRVTLQRPPAGASSARGMPDLRPTVWPVLRYDRTNEALGFLVEAFGFTEALGVTDDDGDAVRARAAPSPPGRRAGASAGAGARRRSAQEDCGPEAPPSTWWRATTSTRSTPAPSAPGAQIVEAPARRPPSGAGARHARVVAARDAEGDLWTFGTYRGAAWSRDRDASACTGERRRSEAADAPSTTAAAPDQLAAAAQCGVVSRDVATRFASVVQRRRARRPRHGPSGWPAGDCLGGR